MDNEDGMLLIIVPTVQLVAQMQGDFESYDPTNTIGDDIHTIMSGREKTTKKRIVVSTWQSIYKMDRDWFNQFTAVICDEVHLATALLLLVSWKNVPKFHTE